MRPKAKTIGSLDEALAAAQFVLSEIARINAMEIDERMARIRENPRQGLGILTVVQEFGCIECGYEALERVFDLTGYICTTNTAVAANAAYETVHTVFVRRFVDRFVKHGHPLNGSSLSSVMQKSANEVAARLCDRTIIIPCVLWQWEDPPQFAIGPVEFVRAKAFFADASNALSRPEGTASLRARQLSEESGWLAIVTVSTMDDATAESRARACVDAAINVIKLFVDPHRTRECRRADTWGPAPDYGLFRREETGSLACTLTRRGSDALGWENWATCFEGQSGVLLSIAQAAVFGLVEPQPPYPLQARLLDALKWFGDGASEASLAARITKYVFAWERLVITRKHDPGTTPSLTTAVCNRIAFLCERIVGEPRGEALLKEIKRLYEVRSNLAHGSASPWEEKELLAHALKAERMTVRALFGAMLHYRSLQRGGASDMELEESLSPPVQSGKLGK